MTGILVDTNVFIDVLRGARKLRLQDDRVAFSVVSRAELFAGRNDAGRLRAFLERFEEIYVGPEIAERAGRLLRETGIDLADGLIAATALEHRLTLVTRNPRDFQPVRGLKLRSPD